MLDESPVVVDDAIEGGQALPEGTEQTPNGTVTPVAAGDREPSSDERVCTACGKIAPRLEIVNARCADCTTRMDNLGSSVVDVKGPHAMQKLAVHQGSLADRVAALEAVVFGENDGPEQG